MEKEMYTQPYKHTAPPKYEPTIPKERIMSGSKEQLGLGAEIDEELKMEENPQAYLENFHTERPYQKWLEVRMSSNPDVTKPVVDQALAALKKVAKLVDKSEKNKRMVQLLIAELEQFKVNA